MTHRRDPFHHGEGQCTNPDHVGLSCQNSTDSGTVRTPGVTELPVEFLIPGDRVVRAAPGRPRDEEERLVVSTRKTGNLVHVQFKDPLGEVSVSYSRGHLLKVRPR